MISSPPDRESIVFEIWSDERQVAEISREPGRDYEIEIYPTGNGGAWNFNLTELMAYLTKGIEELSRSK